MTLQFLKCRKMPFPVGKNAFFVVNITETCYIMQIIVQMKGQKS